MEWNWEEPWNGSLPDGEVVGDSRLGLRSGIGVTGGHVRLRRCCIPCSLIATCFSDSVCVHIQFREFRWIWFSGRDNCLVYIVKFALDLLCHCFVVVVVFYECKNLEGTKNMFRNLSTTTSTLNTNTNWNIYVVISLFCVFKQNQQPSPKKKQHRLRQINIIIPRSLTEIGRPQPRIWSFAKCTDWSLWLCAGPTLFITFDTSFPVCVFRLSIGVRLLRNCTRPGFNPNQSWSMYTWGKSHD